MNISDMICQIAESLASIRKDATIGEIKDTEERIYEIVENAIIDRDDIKDTIFEDYEEEFALAGFSASSTGTNDIPRVNYFAIVY